MSELYLAEVQRQQFSPRFHIFGASPSGYHMPYHTVPKLLLNPTITQYPNLLAPLLVGVERLFISLLPGGQHEAELLNGLPPGDPQCPRSTV